MNALVLGSVDDVKLYEEGRWQPQAVHHPC